MDPPKKGFVKKKTRRWVLTPTQRPNGPSKRRFRFFNSFIYLRGLNVQMDPGEEGLVLFLFCFVFTPSQRPNGP